jgi:hypothetical protein
MGTEDSRVKGYYVRVKSTISGKWLDMGGTYAWPDGWSDSAYLYPTKKLAKARARAFNRGFTFSSRAVVVKVSRKLHS